MLLQVILREVIIILGTGRTGNVLRIKPVVKILIIFVIPIAFYRLTPAGPIQYN
jgi:hypothetical protein